MSGGCTLGVTLQRASKFCPPNFPSVPSGVWKPDTDANTVNERLESSEADEGSF